MHTRRMGVAPPRKFKMLRFLMVLGIAVILSFPMAAQPPTVDISNQVERFVPARQKGVPNRYLVILKDQPSSTARPSRAKGPSVAEVANDIARLYGATPLRTWDLALNGFLVELPEEAARALSRDPRVWLVEQDAYVELQNEAPECTEQTIVPRPYSFPASPQQIQCEHPQPSASDCFDNWGLDRIDQQSGRDGLYNFDLATGVPVHVYLLDTGIRVGHQEFLDGNGPNAHSRIAEGVNLTVGPIDDQYNDLLDCSLNGHGTHVAGILGGMTYGVAKDALIHPVKIGCIGAEISEFVDGVNWIIADRAKRTPPGPAVANLSFNSPKFPDSLGAALAATHLVQSGVTLVQSAGNQNQDAANVTMVGPAFPQEIIIAGGMNEEDARWDSPLHCPPDCGSNYGLNVDIWAPASNIVSSSLRANNAFCQLSGTSMAAPHVAGTAALLLGRFPDASPSAVEKAIKRNGSTDTVMIPTNPPESQSVKLLYSRFPATGRPVAGDDRFLVSPNESRDITFAELLVGDFDWDRDPLAILSIDTPNSNEFQILSNPDRVRYTPPLGFTGEATFTYTVTDGHGNNDDATVRIRVESPVPPPVAMDDNLDVFVRPLVDTLTVAEGTLLANDYSPSGRSFGFKEIVRKPLYGTFSTHFGGGYDYKPNAGFTGEDTFVYRIREAETFLAADATVHLRIVSQLYAPTGWVDGFDQQHIWGWACDPDYPALNNRVDIYTTSGQYLGSADANHPSSDPINSICRGGSAHYFDFHHNGGIAPGTHFMVWSIDMPYATPGNDNRRIGGNGGIGDGTEFVMPSAPACLNNLNLSNQTITTTQVFEACHTITATNFSVGSGGNVTFHAGDWVALGAGFSVSLGGQLKVVVP